ALPSPTHVIEGPQSLGGISQENLKGRTKEKTSQNHAYRSNWNIGTLCLQHGVIKKITELVQFFSFFDTSDTISVRSLHLFCDPSELFTYPCLSVALQVDYSGMLWLICFGVAGITHPSDILEIGVIAFIFIYRYMHYHFKFLKYVDQVAYVARFF
ncbi:hypothetical protein ACJX0J_009476, partial [Zea mays]